jgi:Uncharacterized ACR, COG1430
LNYFRAEAIDWRKIADKKREELNVATPVFHDAGVLKVGNQRPAVRYSPEPHGLEEPRKCCAYNQTKERFLGLDIDAGDFTPANLEDRLPALTPKSGAGLWLLPFRGISPNSVHIPLDLIYLDRDFTVIEVVESFPIFRVSASCPPAASVLVLPSRMVDSTTTQPGDELILCPPEEMKRRLQQQSSLKSAVSAVQAPAPRKEEPTRGSAANLLRWEDRSKPQRSDEDRPVEIPSVSPQVRAVEPVEAEKKVAKPAKNWLQRWLTPAPAQPRKAARESLPGLTAYFWTGGTPIAHDIQDVSATGLYVITDERWYPGTVIRMTLTDSTEPTAERSITVNATAMRWGNDGVGLQFVLKNQGDQRHVQMTGVESIDKKQLEQFLQHIRDKAN